MREKISLDEMRERVAKLIFGDDFISELTDEQYELLRTYGPATRTIVRSNGSPVDLVHAKRCPVGIADKLNCAIGKWTRMCAQGVTVDSWIQDHGLPLDQRQAAARKAFNAMVRVEEKTMNSAAKARQGPKPKILPQITAAMNADISSGRLSRNELSTMMEKTLAERYLFSRERCRAARALVLASLEN